MTDPATIAAGLTEAQREDIVKLGAPTNPFGGLFGALSAADHIKFKALGLVRSHIPSGCYAPLTKLTQTGHAVRNHLLASKEAGNVD